MQLNQYTEISQSEFIAFLNGFTGLSTWCDDCHMYYMVGTKPIGCKSIKFCKYYKKNSI